MSLSNLEVFSQYVQTTTTEILDQKIDLFNAATRGGITLSSGSHEGDYSDATRWKKIDGLVRRRDPYATGAVAAKDLEQILETSVKVAAGTPPVNMPPSMFRWILKNPEEGAAVVAKQLAGDLLQDMLNTAIMSYVAGIGAQAAVNYDYSATGAATLGALNSTAAKFGDAAQSIVSWVCHSKSVHDIYGTALANSERLFQFGNVQVVSDGFGRPLVITDSSALINTTPAPDVYYTLGLTQGGIQLVRNNDFDDNFEASNGDENILRTYQAEWSFQLALRGFAWDKINGDKAPNDAALAVATNWDKYVTSDKDLVGVMLTSQ